MFKTIKALVQPITVSSSKHSKVVYGDETSIEKMIKYLDQYNDVATLEQSEKRRIAYLLCNYYKSLNYYLESAYRAKDEKHNMLLKQKYTDGRKQLEGILLHQYNFKIDAIKKLIDKASLVLSNFVQAEEVIYELKTMAS